MSTDQHVSEGTTESANIHLQMLGEESVVEVPIPPGRQPVRALLPAARELTHHITARAVAAAEHEGRSVSCRAGCGACCRQLVVISVTEAQSLADAVSQMPPERQAMIRQRFAEAIARLEAAGLLDSSESKGDRHLIHPAPNGSLSTSQPLAYRYFQERVACPFLEDESCGIYAERPLVCREYLVTSPASDCSRLYELPIARIEVPVHMGGVMVQLTHKIAGVPVESIPLVLALEWAEHHRGVLDRKVDGIDLVRQLVAETENQRRHDD